MLRVQNETVWRQTKTFFIGSAVLFLINIYFGFDNALTDGVIPRAQVLIHLHAGSIGWITLSQIGIAVWLFTGARQVSEAYAGRVRLLAYASIIAFAGYIVSFGIAFSQGGDFFVLMPIFGTAAMLMIWVAAIFALSQLGKQPVVTNVHLLVAGGLLVAAVGATMGVLLGLELSIGRFLQVTPPEDRVGIHAGMMDSYLILVASGVVEWFLRKNADKRWTWPGLLQALFLTVAAILVPIAFLTGSEQLLPIFGLLLLLGLVFFLARMGWRALAWNPLRDDVKSWVFFGTFWLIVFVVGFMYPILVLQGDFTALPFWFPAVFAHAAFVGTMTNLILAVFSARTADSQHVLSWGEPAARLLINLGMLLFFALKITSDIRLGAIVMGIGVLLGVVTMVQRLRASGGMAAMSPEPSSPAAMG